MRELRFLLGLTLGFVFSVSLYGQVTVDEEYVGDDSADIGGSCYGETGRVFYPCRNYEPRGQSTFSCRHFGENLCDGTKTRKLADADAEHPEIVGGLRLGSHATTSPFPCETTHICRYSPIRRVCISTNQVNIGPMVKVFYQKGGKRMVCPGPYPPLPGEAMPEDADDEIE